MTGSDWGRLLPFPSPAARDAPIDLPAPPADDVVITLRLDLTDVRPAVWRRLEVAGDIPLDVLNDVLMTAMGWMGGHLHQFWPGQAWTGPRFLTDWDIEEGEEGTAESDVRLDQVLRAPGDKLRWSYDFGDSWEHVLKAEKVRPATPDNPPMRCIGGRMACPLEDCGGPPGHAEIRELLATDPGRTRWPDHLREWVPADYDPDDFDPDDVNVALALVGATPEDVLAAFDAAMSETRGASTDELSGLDDRVRTFLVGLPTAATAALSMVAAQSAVPPPATPGLADVARPWQSLLDAAHPDGIPLTAAGRMRPAVVQQLADDTGLSQWWIGKANREDQTYPIADLRTDAVRAGLLRKYKDKLLLTKLGAAVRTDPDAVLTAVAHGLLGGPEPPKPSRSRASWFFSTWPPACRRTKRSRRPWDG